MFSSQFKTAAALGVAMFVLAGLNGCTGSGRASESEKAVGTMADTQAQIERAKQQVTKANSSLDQLSAGGDLQKSFNSYNSAVSDLVSTGEKAKARWNDMRVRGDQYVAKWQSEMEQVTNPEIKQNLAARREKVRADYEKISASAKEVRDAWDPYMSDLQEIKKALSLDLTSEGIKGMQGPMSTAKAKGATLSQKLDAFLTQLAGLLSGMSPAPVM